jgi:hypothetical protein
MVSFVDALETNEIAVLLYTIQAPANSLVPGFVNMGLILTTVKVLGSIYKSITLS